MNKETPANPPQTADQLNRPLTGQVDLPPPQVPIPPTASPAASPAAKIVLEGKTEREIALERELEGERLARKKDQTIAAEWQDKATRLEEAQQTVRSACKKKKLSALQEFFGEKE